MLVQINNLVKEYKDFKAVDLDVLEIKEGEVFGFLGPNGAGKTTTISILSGLYTKFNGSVSIFNKDIRKYSFDIKKDMGVVPQDLALLEDLTAEENVTFFAKLYGLKGAKLKEAVKETLEFVGLWDRRKDFPNKFSGGMKRRLNIACAIVHKPRLIIFDEPTVGIDPQSRNNILDTIKELNKQGSTIIYTSHYMEEVEAICTDICIMDHGKVIAKGSKDEVKALVPKENGEKATLEEVFLHLTGRTLRD
ncbi:ABC-2 type transport system ATP-binding protein [Clostridium cavendishii DSM 21758]|uniref:ABC-2 type transport system ATP-binding protein n=1 Tax=Clostridium cavendishii DSM 21758 TaxID=1121302 RepID=A0A1M6H0K2_9CLOT|nr:ABC transporter ATP-binding protein [Clostridium cavendishii]SHJ15739.1 ABC-2 type transport system ATP-binding protein [Clostridium cavendishii DSM 21758]